MAELPDVVEVRATADPAIHQLTADSRQVQPGAMFVAYRGIDRDSHRYVQDALARGAAAVVGEVELAALPVPYVRVRDGRAALAWLSAAWHGHPSRSMILVGVTGTDGKTTTCNLLFAILRAAGVPCGLISTVNAVIGDQVIDTGLHTTTPDAPEIQGYLAQMRDAGARCAVLEVTSHGLAQHRVTGCAFDVAVLTNVTHEHLDFHGTVEAYRDAKALLFRSLLRSPLKPQLPAPWCGVPKTSILNRDDSSCAYFARIPAARSISYGTTRPNENSSDLELTAGEVSHSQSAMEFRLTAEPDLVGPLPIRSPLAGSFNVSNILAASAAALALGIEPVHIQAGVASVRGITGRMERIDLGQPFLALVDFAHTPNALQRALEAAREISSGHGRVITVFGCAGLRDREKRQMMGTIAARLADLIVITAEDPRTEMLSEIMAETARACHAEGLDEGKQFYQVRDRQRAICTAVDLAGAHDVVIVCGKGHERSMCFDAIEYPWSDQDALRWALERRFGCAEPDPPHILPTYQPHLDRGPGD